MGPATIWEKYMPKSSPSTSGPLPKSEKLIGTSAIVVESPRSRVSVEIERMTRGPAKVSVRIDGEDSDAVAEEVLAIYAHMLVEVAAIEEQTAPGDPS
jgi:membrane protein implicated in regulation of membrane protease activity